MTVLALTFLSGCSLFVPREEARLKQATVEELTALLEPAGGGDPFDERSLQREGAGRDYPHRDACRRRVVYYQRPNAMRMRGFTASRAASSSSSFRPMISSVAFTDDGTVCCPAVRPT